MRRQLQNFATRNKAISWLVGYLNFQIEHHLFPKISRISTTLPSAKTTINKTCKEYGVKYIEFRKNVRHVNVSHATHLKTWQGLIRTRFNIKQPFYDLLLQG
ncbi:MAG: fatty acid desaturase [Chitinophagaceae bacterium]|nr:fatty acid desaturase [Chitinophagaceae bacterium]